jgi:hypothetical protein
MKFDWKRVAITIGIGLVMLFIILSIAPHGFGQERQFANHVITADQYQFMIEYVQINGTLGDADGESYKYLVYDISPAKNSRMVIRIVEFIYCYPPWEGVNITVTTHVNRDDGSRLVISFHMDDATMDRMPDSIIQITMEWDAEGNIIREEARSLSTIMPIWTRYLEYVYEQMNEGVKP